MSASLQTTTDPNKTSDSLSSVHVYHKHKQFEQPKDLKFDGTMNIAQWSNINSKDLKDWNISLYHKTLNTKWLSQMFLFSDNIESTQNFIKSNSQVFDNGSVLTCNTQTKGRGRGKNTWTSPRGCLLFTYLCHLSPRKGKLLPSFQYIVSIAIVETILKLTQNEIKLSLKWPNDIYFMQKNKDNNNDNNIPLKIGGILCESIYSVKLCVYTIIVGIGLNVNNKEPTICINTIIDEFNNNNSNKILKNEENKDNKSENKEEKNDNETQLSHVTREEILATFCNIFEPMYDEFVKNGFHLFKERYLKYWLHSGQKIQVKQENGKDLQVTIIGLTNEGMLLGQDKYGQTYELHPDGNSFDFMKGLICRKRNTI